MSLLPEGGIAVVADGMGGHPGGDVASRVAAQSAADTLQDRTGELGAAMARSVLTAHAAVRAQGEGEADLEGMGTTLTALTIDADTGGFAIGHVGDSRAYRLRGGELTQLTRDDTWVQERVDANELTAEQARNHPFGHILTQCVGLEETPEPQVIEDTVSAGDVYLLCTDGLVGMLDDESLASILREELDGDLGDEAAAAAARALVDAANDAGGYDNVTVVVIAIEG